MLFTNSAFDLFDDIFNDPFFTRPAKQEIPSVMRADVEEQENGYMLDIELPGYAKDEVSAELKDGYLTISACKRTFYVGDQVEQEDIKAAFQNGILRLFIPKDTPKKIEEKPKTITIE